jgi:WD40 repeat protein
MRAAAWMLLAAIAGLASASGAQNCPLPPVLQPLPAGLDTFSDEQEADLGDAMAEQVAPRITIIQNDELAAYLRTLGNRLVQHLPPTKLNFRFYLIEFPEPNAFSIAGGRVYVSRKLIAMTRSEDELAGVIAHELGHIVTHQTGIYMTRRFREVLNVNQVGDRADVYARYHQYVENYMRRPSRGESEEKEQGAADQVGIFAGYRSGYAPQAFVDMLDRLQETHGQTGTWLSNLFGTTRPEQHRLRDLIRSLAALPPGCADARPATSAEAFTNWRQQIIDYSGSGGAESVPGLISKTALALPLRPDISNFRFSPDGKHLIAQDEGGIHVLTRDPLAVLFYIPAPEAFNAEFTPDSQSITFYTHSLRVETWSVATQSRTEAHEVLMRGYCLQSTLSRDGKALACLNHEHDLVLLDVASSSPIVTRKQFWQPTFSDLIFLLTKFALHKDEAEDFKYIQMGFSPDGRYFLAGFGLATVVYDLASRKEVSLPGSIRDHMHAGFVFLGTDRIVVVDQMAPNKSPVLKFPSGEHLQQVGLALGLTLRSVTRGDYFLVGPLKDYPLGLYDVEAKKGLIFFKRDASDVYDDVMVSEQRDGEIALTTVGKLEVLAKVNLPQARLEKVHADAVSSDLQWLAVSNRSRAAIWDVSRNIRTQYVRSFDGAWFSPNSVFYADFPKYDNASRAIGALALNGTTMNIAYRPGDIVAAQQGPFLVVTTPKERSITSNCDIEIRDIATNKPVWSRHFPHELPSVHLSAAGTVLLGWGLGESGGHDELQNFPDLKNQASKDDFLFELVDLKSGSVTGKLLVRTNRRSLRLETSFAGGDWVVVAAEGNQILVYSLSSGAERGQFFGNNPQLLVRSGVLAVDKDANELDLYDLNTQTLWRRYVFAEPIALRQMSNDGHLLVLTQSQTAYLIDTAAEQ